MISPLKFIALVILLAGLAIAGTAVAFKLTHRQAMAAAPVNPAPLHAALQRGRGEMALP